jgi:hypothetical protein
MNKSFEAKRLSVLGMNLKTAIEGKGRRSRGRKPVTKDFGLSSYGSGEPLKDLKRKQHAGSKGMVQLVERLPSKCKTLSS